MSKAVKVGNVFIGGGHRISVQSMTNVKTDDAQSLIEQIKKLESAGADIVRVSVNTRNALKGFAEAVKFSKVPLVADIHYDYNLALGAIDAGASKIRINPGNMSTDGLRKICEALKSNDIPVRVGVNSGSIEKDILEKFGNTPKALCESALRIVKQLEDFGVFNIVVSAKSSSTLDTIETYRLLAKETVYPLHVGVTEAGGGEFAVIKSSVGIGTLLAENIGDTIRVSLSDDPVKEIEAGKNILRALGLDKNFVDIISCPTCGRTEFDVIGCSERLSQIFKEYKTPLKIAVMGCVVNGLGEGAFADFGIAGGKDKSIIFQDGKQIAILDNTQAENFLVNLVKNRISK